MSGDTRPFTPNSLLILLTWMGAGLTIAAAIILLRGRALPAEVGFA